MTKYFTSIFLAVALITTTVVNFVHSHDITSGIKVSEHCQVCDISRHIGSGVVLSDGPRIPVFYLDQHEYSSSFLFISFEFVHGTRCRGPPYFI